MNSLILQECKKTDELLELCEFTDDAKFHLLYRASRDGFSAEDFHSKCDGHKNTLTLIKSENSNVFGGFTEVDWSGNGYIGDHNAFIFSLINENIPVKMKCVEPTSSIYRDSKNGPTFGHDLYLCDNSNVSVSSYSNPGNTYSNELLNNHRFHIKPTMSGSYNFKTVEIEVFEVEK